MDKFKVLEIKKSVFSSNEKRADELLRPVKGEKVVFIKLDVLSGFREDHNAYQNH